MPKILVVEDEAALADALEYSLTAESFDVVVATDGEQALRLFDQQRPDLVLLDVMLPGLSGVEVCKRIRARSAVPIIMVTARDTEIDKVVGLELGADDYVTKPYSTRELAAPCCDAARNRSTSSWTLPRRSRGSASTPSATR
jgi:two-component system, OmpR family, response regulator RegX3